MFPPVEQSFRWSLSFDGICFAMREVITRSEVGLLDITIIIIDEKRSDKIRSNLETFFLVEADFFYKPSLILSRWL